MRSADDVLNNGVLISKGHQTAKVKRENLSLISTEKEAEKLFRHCEPYVADKNSFGDIDHLKRIDEN